MTYEKLWHVARKAGLVVAWGVRGARTGHVGRSGVTGVV